MNDINTFKILQPFQEKNVLSSSEKAQVHSTKVNPLPSEIQQNNFWIKISNRCETRKWKKKVRIEHTSSVINGKKKEKRNLIFLKLLKFVFVSLFKFIDFSLFHLTSLYFLYFLASSTCIYYMFSFYLLFTGLATLCYFDWKVVLFAKTFLSLAG